MRLILIESLTLGPTCVSFLSPPVQVARWALMHRFLSVVCLSVVWTWPKRGKIIHISGSIKVRNLKLYHNILASDYTLRKIHFSNWVRHYIAVTGRAHCQRQVAFFPFWVILASHDLLLSLTCLPYIHSYKRFWENLSPKPSVRNHLKVLQIQ